MITVAYPLIKAHAQAEPVALLQFDAHCDTWESSSPLDHGTMFLSAVNEGLLDVDHSIQVGLRTHNDIDVGIEVLTAPGCTATGSTRRWRRSASGWATGRST